MLHSTWRAGRWPLAITFMAALNACADIPTVPRSMNDSRVPREAHATVDEGTQVFFRIDDTAVLDSNKDRVRVTGYVGCSAPASFEVVVALLKEPKRDEMPVFVESITLPAIQCTTAYAPWSVVFDSAKGLHHNGPALVNIYTGKPKSPITPTGITQLVTLVRESR